MTDSSISSHINLFIQSSVESVVLKNPKLYTDNIYHLLQTSIFRVVDWHDIALKY